MLMKCVNKRSIIIIYVRMSSYCIYCLYPHGIHSLLDLEIKLSMNIAAGILNGASSSGPCYTVWHGK